MTDEDDRKRKLYLLIVVALLIAFLSFSLAQIALDIANINNVYQPVPNNTDIGFGGMGTGTEERKPFVTYWANESPIEVYLIAHVVGTGGKETIQVNISINGTVVQETLRDRTITLGLHEHFPLNARVCKGCNYSVGNNTRIYDVEWREYPILSGKNGTLSLNQTFITTGSSFNATYDQTTKEYNANYSSQTFPNMSIYGLVDILNSSKVNKTGDTMTGLLTGNAGINTTQINLTSNSYLYADTLTLGSQTIPANAETLIKWHANVDTLGELKNNHNFSVLNSGNYYISSCAFVSGQSFGNRYYTRLRIADTNTVFFSDDHPSREAAANASTLCGNIIRKINGGQNISIVIFTDATAGNTLTADSRTFLTIQKVS